MTQLTTFDYLLATILVALFIAYLVNVARLIIYLLSNKH